jgi:hypothetical protein
MGLHRKTAALRSLRPNIAILSEVANIPTTWFESMVSFEIGNFEDWSRFSDHALLIVKFGCL